MTRDIRWKQRFNNYIKAMQLMERCLPDDSANMPEKDMLALVQSYEILSELGWRLMKDYLEAYGTLKKPVTAVGVVRQAFNVGIIDDGQIWVDIIEKRNLTSHVYNEEIALELVTNIVEKFIYTFRNLADTFTEYNKQ